MGAWIALNQFNYFNSQIKGLIGIGSAPEFLKRLMWNKFSNKVKKEIISKGKTIVKNGKYEYPISYQLIKDGNNNKVLNRKNNLQIKVTMIHGKKDEVVPVVFSRLVLSKFKKANKKLVLVKNGDHSLSKKSNLKIILKELTNIIKNVV